jgi:hypothetical protein
MQRGASGPKAASTASLPSRDSSPALITSSSTLYSANKCSAVLRFAGGAGGHRAITRHAEFIHHFAEMAEGLRGFLENLFAEAVAQENAFAQTQRIAFLVHRFDIERGISPRHGQAEGVGAGVDSGNVNRVRHFGIYRQR